MRSIALLLVCVVLGVAFQPQFPNRISRRISRRSYTTALKFSELNELRSLIDEAGGQVGISADPAVVTKIERVVDALPQTKNPTAIPLTGTHELLFSMAKGGSNGKVGPFVGKVNQIFVDDTNFINQVTLGPLKVELLATREILDDKRVRVTFKKTRFNLFGNTLKETETKGSGVWTIKFFEDGLRIMDTPSLFIIKALK
ncbi:hypothetical protein TrST_g10696 [Triparma strigata]|uniref:Plastid lipid-associated protein/fibrillin conserved domain-containing protein n=1 Tax=Triparma strigata TaxID=1606541 RepID=A0A9W7BUF5_9STRA|nr:hypothetical protein TrST_g10696 [Triparma strigata]